MNAGSVHWNELYLIPIMYHNGGFWGDFYTDLTTQKMIRNGPEFPPKHHINDDLISGTFDILWQLDGTSCLEIAQQPSCCQYTLKNLTSSECSSTIYHCTVQ